MCVGFELRACQQRLNAQELADSVAVGRVAELTEHSIQNSKNSLNLARFWWDEGLAERVGFEPTVEFPLHTLSKRAPSTTRTSLRLESTTCEQLRTDYRTRRRR